MTRRLLCACLGAAAFVGALDLPARTFAKPPDLPLNDPITVTPQTAPAQADQVYSEIRIDVSDANTGPLIFGVGVNSNAGLTGSMVVNERNFDAVQGRAKEELPAAVPTPALYQLRPTARRNLAGSMLFGVNPLLALLPTDKALDTPRDHPQKVTGDDLFGDMPMPQVAYSGLSGKVFVHEEIDWFKWWMIRLAVQHPTPTPEQNDGYISTIKGASIIAGLTAVDAPASESDSPAACTAEALPMPQEDKPAKKNKKHHRKGERLPMPQEDAPAATSVDGITCPYLRQKYVDRHACQLADPEIGRDVLDNLERLKKAEALLKSAERFARSGNIVEALDCCTRAQDLCPGSPCASRAATVMREVWSGAHESATDTEEATEETAEAPGVEQQVDGLMKACRLLMNEGLHEQAAELARQAFALDPERVMADPLLYKMHLLADTPAKHSAEPSEESEPPSCPYCPPIGKPIPGIVPEKKKTESGPATLLVPPLPPIDYEVVPALDRMLTETATGAEKASELERELTEAATGAEEASEDDMPSSLADLVESIMGDCDRYQFGIGADGKVQASGELAFGSSVYHILYKRGCLAIWKTPDAAKTKP